MAKKNTNEQKHLPVSDTAEALPAPEPATEETEMAEAPSAPEPAVEEPETAEALPATAPDEPLYYITTTEDVVYIRSDPQFKADGSNIIGKIIEKSGNKNRHGISRKENGYGKLSDISGWIDLSFTSRITK